MSWQAQHFVDLGVQVSWKAQHFVNLEGQMSRKAEARNLQGKNRTKPTRIGHRLVADSDFPRTEAVAASKPKPNQPESVTKWSLFRSSLPNRNPLPGRGADFVAGAEICRSWSAGFVAGAALCEPRSADVAAGGSKKPGGKNPNLNQPESVTKWSLIRRMALD